MYTAGREQGEQIDSRNEALHWRTARYFWLWCGIAAIGGMLGFLTGASNSPVVGTAISGILGGVFGFVGGFLSPNRKKQD